MLIYGKNTVTETLKSGKKVSKVYLSSELNDTNLVDLVKKAKVEVIFMPRNKMNQKFEGNHQGIVAEVAEYEYKQLEEVVEKCSEKDAVLAVLDGLEDPHNLGAILRTCDASGVDGVIIGKNRSVRLNNTVAKVSTGAIEYVKVAEVTNLNNTIKYLKKQGYWIVGAEATDESILYNKMKYDMPICLVIGSEGKGLSRLVRENCDYLIKIPMVGHVNSLNASVSCSILVYEIIKYRNL